MWAAGASDGGGWFTGSNGWPEEDASRAAYHNTAETTEKFVTANVQVLTTSRIHQLLNHSCTPNIHIFRSNESSHKMNQAQFRKCQVVRLQPTLSERIRFIWEAQKKTKYLARLISSENKVRRSQHLCVRQPRLCLFVADGILHCFPGQERHPWSRPIAQDPLYNS